MKHFLLFYDVADDFLARRAAFRDAHLAQVVESFASTDPYVVNGLVTRWWIREWLTVAGENAATPVRPATRSPHDRSKDHGI